MISIAMIGSSGAMGREIARLAPEFDAKIVEKFDAERPLADASSLDCDVAIDFTLPGVVVDNVRHLLDLEIPIVVGTTGWGDRLDEVTGMVDAKKGRLLHASNFSVGVQSFFRIVRQAARLLDDVGGYDVALHEDHHIRKADAPSGTALSLADIVLEESSVKQSIEADRPPDGRIDPSALHVSSRRIGHVIGTHEAIFDAEADSIELTHRARNRSGFARGALLAATWLPSQPPGTYDFGTEFESIITSARP